MFQAHSFLRFNQEVPTPSAQNSFMHSCHTLQPLDSSDLIQTAVDPHHFQTRQHFNEYNLQGRNFVEGEDDEGVNHKGGVNGGKNQNKRKKVVDKRSDIIKGLWNPEEDGMKLLVNDDPTTLSYWLNWRVFLCAVWVLAPMVIAAFIIWKHEHSGNSESDAGGNQQESSHIRSEKSWKPCLKEIHPVFLLCFRIIAFGLLLTAVSFDLALHGAELFYYYTQWTFTLVTIYFGLGSLLSIRGCFYSPIIDSNSKCYLNEDTEQALHVPLAHGVNGNGMRLPEKLDGHGTLHTLITSDVWDDLYQVLFQMTAGAVTLTDIVYWGVIFPFMALKDYEMGFLTVVTHSVNAVLLLGDTAMCSLEFPWFRISYFILLTGIYVIFQWIVHACVSIWWPYPFLDLSANLAPMWYLVVALMHVPCYAIFLMFVKVKHWLLSRWFPHSYQYSS